MAPIRNISVTVMIAKLLSLNTYGLIHSEHPRPEHQSIVHVIYPWVPLNILQHNNYCLQINYFDRVRRILTYKHKSQPI